MTKDLWNNVKGTLKALDFGEILKDSSRTAMAVSSARTSKNKMETAFLISNALFGTYCVAKKVYDSIKDEHIGYDNEVSILQSDDLYSVARDFIWKNSSDRNDISSYSLGSRFLPEREALRHESEGLASIPRGMDIDPYTEMYADREYNLRGKYALAFSTEEETSILCEKGGIKFYATMVPMTGSDGREGRVSSRPSSIILGFRTQKEQKTILEDLRDGLMKSSKLDPSIYICKPWGVFEGRSIPLMRTTDSVFLKDGQLDRIIKDINTFIHSAEKYDELGIPHTMGVLLHGPPGTGKTSVIQAIAHSLSMNVYYIKLSSIHDDESLESAFSYVRPGSIIMLEEIDDAGSSKTRSGDDEEQYGPGPTLTGLLNTLDGVTAARGCVVMGTTNHAERLDPALVRAGRFSSKEELGYLDHSQLEKMCMHFIGNVPDDLPTITESHKISPADVVDVFRRHIPETHLAGPALVKSLEEKIMEQAMEEDQNV